MKELIEIMQKNIRPCLFGIFCVLQFILLSALLLRNI